MTLHPYLHLARYNPNLYEILGISSDATEDEIRDGYLARAKETHPDRNPALKGNTEPFKVVRDAYDTLRDPLSRARYDRKSGIHALRQKAASDQRQAAVRAEAERQRANEEKAAAERRRNIDLEIRRKAEESQRVKEARREAEELRPRRIKRTVRPGAWADPEKTERALVALNALAKDVAKDVFGPSWQGLGRTEENAVVSGIVGLWASQYRSTWDKLVSPDADFELDETQVINQMRDFAQEERRLRRRHAEREIVMPTESPEGEALPGLEGYADTTTPLQDERDFRRASRLKDKAEEQKNASPILNFLFGLHREEETLPGTSKHIKGALSDLAKFHGAGMRSSDTNLAWQLRAKALCPTCRKIGRIVRQDPRIIEDLIDAQIQALRKASEN